MVRVAGAKEGLEVQSDVIQNGKLSGKPKEKFTRHSVLSRKGLSAGVTQHSVGRTHSAGKHYNRALLLRLILQQGPISRLALSRLTRLSPAALISLTGQLLDEGRLVEAGEALNDEEVGRVGRRSTLLDLNAGSSLAFGVHIAPRAVRIGLVDLKGQVRSKIRLGPPSQEAGQTLDQIAETILQLLEDAQLLPQSILGIGVGAVGLVQHEQGINLSALSLQWRNIPIRAELEERLGLPVLVDNNARTMALAEHLFGRDLPHRATDLALVYVGAGIGAGVVIEGQPYRGSAEAAGEIGHIMVVPGGELCYCGGRGCLETVASEAGLIRQAQKLVETGSSSFLASWSGSITLEALVQAVEAGDQAVLNLVNQAGEYLGVAVSAIAKILNPQTLILAGPLMDGRLPLLGRVQTVFEASTSVPGGVCTLLLTSLGEDIGIIGGASLALYDRVFSPQQ